jgi:two-component system aerobic respiration control protein ArcA
MKKRGFFDKGFTKKIQDLNKKALAQEHVVSLDAYRNVIKQNQVKTLLVVDDESVMRNAIKRIFEKQDYRVLVAKDAMELSKIIEETNVDIVLLDIGLPWVDGYEICSLIKSHPILKDVPVAFVSGYKTEEDIRKGFEMGCDEYITKPFEIEDLQKTVEKLLLKSS